MNIVIQIDKDGFVESVLHDGAEGEHVDIIVEDYNTLEGDQTDMDGVPVYKYDVADVRDPGLVGQIFKHYSSTANDIWED